MSDLARYLQPVKRPPAWLWAMAISGFAVSATMLLELNSVLAEMWQMQTVAARLRIEAPVRPRMGPQEEANNEEWRKLSVERKFNWYPVFLALEKASGDEIELLEFRPDKANGQISLRGEARNLPALVDYLERLAKQPLIAKVYLSHQKSTQRDAMQLVAFEIQASMRSDR